MGERKDGGTQWRMGEGMKEKIATQDGSKDEGEGCGKDGGKGRRKKRRRKYILLGFGGLSSAVQSWWVLNQPVLAWSPKTYKVRVPGLRNEFMKNLVQPGPGPTVTLSV